MVCNLKLRLEYVLAATCTLIALYTRHLSKECDPIVNTSNSIDTFDPLD